MIEKGRQPPIHLPAWLQFVVMSASGITAYLLARSGHDTDNLLTFTLASAAGAIFIHLLATFGKSFLGMRPKQQQSSDFGKQTSSIGLERSISSNANVFEPPSRWVALISIVTMIACLALGLAGKTWVMQLSGVRHPSGWILLLTGLNLIMVLFGWALIGAWAAGALVLIGSDDVDDPSVLRLSFAAISSVAYFALYFWVAIYRGLDALLFAAK